jgi:hypothetical protein
MSRIDELIAEHCPDGVEFKELGELLDYEQPGKYLVDSTAYDDSYTIPVLTAGQTFILGYTDETNGIYPASPENPVIIFDDFTTAFKWVDFPFKAKSSAMKMLTPKSNAMENLRYAYHLMQTISYVPQDHARQWIGTYSKFRVPIPPLEIQREIVKVLDTFTKLEAELEAELEARKKQYNYYRDQLLSFEEGEVEWRTLLDACDYVDYRGKTPTKTQEGIFLVTAKNIRMGYIDYAASQEFISEHDFNTVMRRGHPKLGDVLITTEAPCGFVAQVDRENIALAQRSRNERLTNAFLKHYLLGRHFQDKLMKAATGSTVKGIKGSRLHQLTIPIPSKAEQARIVAILDKFDALTNSLTEGLPREIELRQKQYAHYRDLLLSFPKPEEVGA